jgi:hypothetical protein
VLVGGGGNHTHTHTHTHSCRHFYANEGRDSAINKAGFLHNTT